MTKKLSKSARSRTTRSRQRKQKAGVLSRFFRIVVLTNIALILIAVVVVVGEVFVYGKFVESLQAQNIIVASADPEDDQSPVVAIHVSADKSIEVIELAPSVIVEVSGGYGEYELRSVLPLLKLDKKSAVQTQATFSFALNTGVSQVWQDNNLESGIAAPQIRQLGWRLIKGQVKTPLSLWHQFHWGVYLSRLPETEISFNQAQTLEEWETGRKWWSLGKLLHLCSIAVVNTTDTPGLGAKVSQVLESTGLNVIRVANAQERAEETSIFVDFDGSENSTCKQVTTFLTSFIPNTEKVIFDETKTRQHRASIVVVLGENNAGL